MGFEHRGGFSKMLLIFVVSKIGSNNFQFDAVSGHIDGPEEIEVQDTSGAAELLSRRFMRTTNQHKAAGGSSFEEPDDAVYFLSLNARLVCQFNLLRLRVPK